MSDETTSASKRRHPNRRRRRAASRLRWAGFAAGGTGLLVVAGLLLGGLSGGGLPGVSVVLGGDDSAAPNGSTSTTSSSPSPTAAGANGSGTGTGAGVGRPDGGTLSAAGGGGTGTGGRAGLPSPSPSGPGGTSTPTQPSSPAGPGTANPPDTPGDTAAPRAVPDAEKLAGAAVTAADLGGGWKQITGGIEGIGFACDAGRTITADTSATRALRRPGVTVTNHNFGYAGTGAADTFAAYRAAAVSCPGWKISEYARSLTITVTVTEDSPNHLVLSYEIKDRGHPTTYQVEHILLAGNTLGVVSLETQAVPAKELLTTVNGAVGAVAARLAALSV